MERREIYPIALLILMILISIASYDQIALNAQGQMPVHWNAQGTADEFGSRLLGLSLLPIIAIFTYLLLFFIPRFEVHAANMLAFRNHLYWFKIVTILFFLTIHMAAIEYSTHGPYNMSYVFIPALSILFIFVGYIMRTVKQNFFIGIRTPWTLSSEIVWEKTHAVGSKLFIALGILLPISLFFLNYFVWVFLGALLLISGGLIIYSAQEYNKIERLKK